MITWYWFYTHFVWGGSLASPQDMPGLPNPHTQGEAYLVWFLGLAVAAVVALFVLNQKIHGGHKKSIREQDEAYQKEIKAQMEATESRSKEVSDRLFIMIERVTGVQKENTAAVQALTTELARTAARGG